MSNLLESFRRFSTALATNPPGQEGKPLPLAAELLANYPDDPRFWLQYAETCQAQEDYREASLALARMDGLLQGERVATAGSPQLAPILDALLWRQLKCHTEMLKVVARGNPSAQADLIHQLQRLAALSYQGICKGLADTRAWMDDSCDSGRMVDPNWVVRLERFSNTHDPSHDADLNVILDLATALMGAGRYAEAEQLFEGPPFSLIVAPQEDYERFQRKKLWFPKLLYWLKPFLQEPLRQVIPFTTPDDRYVLAMVVWGDPFLDSLERFTLPSLLAEGNLPYLQGSGEAHFLIFTTTTGAKRLEEMPVFQAVKGIVPVDIVTFPSELTNPCDVYKLMSAMHLVGMKIAQASHAHFFFVAPDIVVADNFLRVLDQRMRQGAEVVFVPGLMLHMESFGEELAHSLPAVDRALSISPRELLQLGVRHLHPFAKEAYVYSPNKRRPSGSALLWPLAGGGYLDHAFHLTPFLVSARAMERFDGSSFFTIDGEFLLKIIRTQEEMERCVLLTDMQETNYFELSRGGRFDYPLEFGMERLCRWGALQGLVAKWLFRQKACFDPRGKGSTDPSYTASTLVVEEILQGMERVEQGATHLPAGTGVP